jgi:predicted RNase H-like nuclease (RuvC/YqgF family)
MREKKLSDFYWAYADILRGIGINESMSMVADIKVEKESNANLRNEINELKKQLDDTKNFEVKDTLEYKELEDKYNKLKDEGQKLLDQTNQMKDDFNACCLKFGITRSKNGRWVMNGKSEESEESK